MFEKGGLSCQLARVLCIVDKGHSARPMAGVIQGRSRVDKEYYARPMTGVIEGGMQRGTGWGAVVGSLILWQKRPSFMAKKT